MKWRAYGLICLMAFPCGCGRTDSPSKQASVGWGKAEMSTQGRKFIAEGIGPGPAVTSRGGDSVLLTVAGKQIEVQKDQILVGGVTKAKIAPETRSIRAVSRDNEIIVEVDGKEEFRLAL